MSVRIGILGCAKIAPLALTRPAKKVDGVEIAAVGSRSLRRAERFARRHGIPRAHGSYDAVLADADVDAVYVPLPNSLHAPWTLKALEAGKHVLCEKPLASNEREAKELAAAAGEASRLVAMEAFHYRYHPLMARVKQLVQTEEIGELRAVDVLFQVPILLPKDIRWSAELAGGATMDVGCYTVSLARFLCPGEPDVLTASGALTRGGVDRSFDASLAFRKGVEARVRGSILGPPAARLEVRGTRGRIVVWNPIAPQYFYRLTVEVDAAKRRETVAGGATYVHQLAAFRDAIRHGAPVETDFEDSVANQRVLDQIRILIGVTTAW